MPFAQTITLKDVLGRIPTCHRQRQSSFTATSACNAAGENGRSWRSRSVRMMKGKKKANDEPKHIDDDDSTIADVLEIDPDGERLYNMVSSQDWDGVVALCQTRSSRIPLYRDRYGNNPLHIALKRHCRLDAVKAIISSCPDAASSTNRHGQVPLHNAHYFGSCVDAVKVVYDAYPHASLQQDANGETPFHSFCREHFHKVSVLKMLILGCPASLSVQNKANETPFLVYYHRIYVHRELRFSYLASFMRIACYQTHLESTPENGYPTYLLHASLRMIDCPLAISLHCARKLPKECCCTDSDGNFPLHIAACMLPRKIKAGGVLSKVKFCCEPSLSEQCRELIEALVSRYPNAARLANNDGRLPLELIIESGGSWGAGVQAILDAYPISLLKMGAECKGSLLPDMLARIGGEGQKLTTMFELIKEKPDLVLRDKNRSK